MAMEDWKKVLFILPALIIVICIRLIVRYALNKCCDACCDMVCGKSSENTEPSNNEPPVVVTSQTHTTPSGYPITTTVQNTGSGFQATPYPTTMPMPQGTGNFSNPPYPTGYGAQPMPQPMSQTTPYPPAPGFTPYPPEAPSVPSAASQNPPSYDQVVGTDSYSKQAPYNPNYVNH